MRPQKTRREYTFIKIKKIKKCFRTSSMVLTTPAIEIEPSGDVSYLGVQPFRVHDSYLAIASCLLLDYDRLEYSSLEAWFYQF